MTKKRSNFISAHKKLAVIVAVLLFLVIAVAARLMYECTVVSEMRAIGDSFQPDASWSLKYNNATPPHLVCIDIECPRYSRGWTVPVAISKAEFAKIVKRSADKNLVKTNTCVERTDNSILVCEMEYMVDNYRLLVRYDSQTLVAGQELSIEVKK